MDEPRQHGAGASVTDCVRQFRRLSRLAAADPLRLLPLDALTQLARLSAPVTDLIDLAPFERLRGAAAAPAAVAHNGAPRMRLQPFPRTGIDPRAKAAAVAGTPAPEAATGSGAPAAARQVSAFASHLRSAEEPPRHGSASTPTLAERRAALRRKTIDGGVPSRSTSRVVPEVGAMPGLRHPSSNEAREIGVPPRRRSDEEIRDAARELTRAPVEPVLFDRDAVASAWTEPLPPSALDRATHHASFADQRQAASPPAEPPGAPGTHAPADIPAGSALPAAAVRTGADELEPSPAAAAPSSRVAGFAPLDTRMSQPDAGAATRRRGAEPPAESELADALFETLYRDGVDLTWP